jgi:hypothetical protein
VFGGGATCGFAGGGSSRAGFTALGCFWGAGFCAAGAGFEVAGGGTAAVFVSHAANVVTRSIDAAAATARYSVMRPVKQEVMNGDPCGQPPAIGYLVL